MSKKDIANKVLEDLIWFDEQVKHRDFVEEPEDDEPEYDVDQLVNNLPFIASERTLTTRKPKQIFFINDISKDEKPIL